MLGPRPACRAFRRGVGIAAEHAARVPAPQEPPTRRSLSRLFADAPLEEAPQRLVVRLNTGPDAQRAQQKHYAVRPFDCAHSASAVARTGQVCRVIPPCTTVRGARPAARVADPGSPEPPGSTNAIRSGKSDSCRKDAARPPGLVATALLWGARGAPAMRAGTVSPGSVNNRFSITPHPSPPGLNVADLRPQ